CCGVPNAACHPCVCTGKC
uniref:Alpha-conotoxin PeIVA n=1 Tax=Conus pergrandis TaxID=330676 RepID=CA4A_CONPR|nr:RecName: Full=Alpha-conotoxin PeIVA [Conus pergrandis]